MQKGSKDVGLGLVVVMVVTAVPLVKRNWCGRASS